MPENSHRENQPDRPEGRPENGEQEPDSPAFTSSQPPEQSQPSQASAVDAEGEGEAAGPEAATPVAPGRPATEAAGTQADAGAGSREEQGRAETVTSYERTAQGHRVTRRTVNRREVSEETEETEETITETYPVPYQPPTSTRHPTPVG